MGCWMKRLTLDLSSCKYTVISISCKSIIISFKYSTKQLLQLWIIQNILHMLEVVAITTWDNKSMISVSTFSRKTLTIQTRPLGDLLTKMTDDMKQLFQNHQL